MSQIPESPRIEGLIAIAGPAVNFVLALLGFLFGMPWADASGSELLAWFIGVNLVMGLFNLLPAFPMDGGRLLRAFLGRRGNWLAATENAVRIGRWFALLLAVLGVTGIPGLLGANWVLPLVALFVWASGYQELATLRARHAPSAAPPRAGFGPEEIEALERYRGRLSDSRPEDR